jgi:dTDP-4-amino-4,6-dideoxygalactose transaminase
MTTSSPSKSGQSPGLAKIDFIDLKAQQARIRPAVDKAVARVLDHGQYIMGPEIAEFEQRLAGFCGAKHAVSCASGTDALLMIMMAKGIGPGDAVLCPAFTYTATPETIALLGATPVFCEVDADTYNLDPAKLSMGLAAARSAGLTPRALIAVDHAPIEAFAAAHDLFVIADAAQGFGGSYHGRKVGTFGLATATSFFPAKPLGCYGDGGAILTDNAALADLLRSIRLHGKGDDKYDIVRIGINGRLDTLQAGILLTKLDIFADEIEARQRVADRYTRGLHNVVTTPHVPAGSTSVWAQYTIQVDARARDPLMQALNAQGIPTMVYYPRGLHQQTAYQQYPVATEGVPISERLPRTVLSLPMHPYLDDATVDRIVGAVQAALLPR